MTFFLDSFYRAKTGSIDLSRVKNWKVEYKSPEKNGRVERLHLSLKKEAFDNVAPINLNHAQRISSEYKDYYNNCRPHHGISGKIPGRIFSESPSERVGFIQNRNSQPTGYSLSQYALTNMVNYSKSRCCTVDI